jgi:hypothetical protein
MLKWRWVFKGNEVVYNIDTIVDKVSIHLENNSYDTQSEAIEAIEVFIEDLEYQFNVYSYDVKTYFGTDLTLVQYYKFN